MKRNIQKETDDAKRKLFVLLCEQLPAVTDREARLLMHLVRDEAIKSANTRKS